MPHSMSMDPTQADRLDRKTGAIVFLAFAAAYFFSALVRAITATLAPVLTQEFALQARDLGLLAGGYFLGFAAMQLPLGKLLDRHGPKRVILYFLSLSVLGCLAFSLATSFAWLLAARVLVGMGVSACMMAPLTGFRRWYDTPTLLRANSWMLMTGSLGMLASTLPVQWLMPLTGWRPLFWILAAMILLSMAALAKVVPRWRDVAPTLAAARTALPPGGAAAPAVRQSQSRGPGLNENLSAPTRFTALTSVPTSDNGYAEVWKSAYFRRMAPLAIFNYGGLVAVQTLWAGPWMVKVAGYSALGAATGLFYINGCMLVTFWTWGMVNPYLAHHGWPANRLLAWGVPLSLLALAANIAGGTAVGWPGWALFCVASSVMGLAQPAVGMAFAPALAGRGLSAYNLMVFGGVFIVQWGIGLLIDAFAVIGFSQVASFQAAMAVFLCCCVASYAWFMVRRNATADNLLK